MPLQYLYGNSLQIEMNIALEEILLQKILLHFSSEFKKLDRKFLSKSIARIHKNAILNACLYLIGSHSLPK